MCEVLSLARLTGITEGVSHPLWRKREKGNNDRRRWCTSFSRQVISRNALTMADSVAASRDSTAKFGGDSSSSERAAIALPSVETEAGTASGEVPIASDDELGGTLMTELVALEASSSVSSGTTTGNSTTIVPSRSPSSATRMRGGMRGITLPPALADVIGLRPNTGPRRRISTSPALGLALTSQARTERQCQSETSRSSQAIEVTEQGTIPIATRTSIDARRTGRDST